MKKFILFLFTGALLCAALYFFGVNNRYIFTSPAEEGGDIKIGHINICGFTESRDRRLTAEKMLQTASQNGVDALFVQEFQLNWKFTEKDFRKLASKYYRNVSVNGECAVVSNFPIISHDRKFFSDQSDKFSSVHLDVNGRDVRVFAPHLRTTGLYYFGYGRDVSNTNNISKARGLIRQNKKIRIAQSESLRDAINYSSTPVLVAGDFNSLPWTKVMRNVQRFFLKDCFMEKGSGKGSTFKEMRDLPRIDYILHDDHFKCLDAQIIQEDLSDHRMIVATLQFK